jgi:hypothetical protein
MNNKSDIQNLVETTLVSLNGIQKASPGPYFITRVQARLAKAEKNIWETLSAFISRPAVAVGMVTFVLLMNTFAVIQHKKISALPVEQADQSVYEEFNVAVNTFYDYEIK